MNHLIGYSFENLSLMMINQTIYDKIHAFVKKNKVNDRDTNFLIKFFRFETRSHIKRLSHIRVPQASDEKV